MRDLTIILAVLFLALPAAVPAQAGETTELTVAADIPGARAAVYAVAIDPETEYSDGESLRTLGETLEEVIRSSGAEPAAEAETGEGGSARVYVRRNGTYLVLAEDRRGEREKARFLPALVFTGNEAEMTVKLKKEIAAAPAYPGNGDGGGGRGQTGGGENTFRKDAEPAAGVPAERGVLGSVRKELPEPEVLGKSRLPQTGQLWWPVPVLLCGALLLTAWNILDGRRAAAAAGKAAVQVETAVREEKTAKEKTAVPDYWSHPEMPMPAVEIDGERYIGILRVPDLSLELPVMENWSYPGLRLAPCRYAGSAYLDNLVLCGHNYPEHFGRISELRGGAEMTFSDTAGNDFRYVVCGMEVLTAESAEIIREAQGGDLTLFTCTPGGKTRYAVFCRRLRMVE